MGSQRLRQDYEALFAGRKASFPKYVEACLTHPGFLACTLLRVQERCYDSGLLRLSSFIRLVNNGLTGADLLPGCRIGGGLMMHHPVGIVIGHKVVVGENCTILQGVTLGESYSRRDMSHSYPIIEDFVTIGAGATILGDVRIGKRARVAANSVVLNSVPADCVAVGQPARIL